MFLNGEGIERSA